MTDKENQLARIKQMEQAMDQLLKAEKAMNAALDAMHSAHPLVKDLNAYYGGEWRQDFEDDEAGLLPKNLKRGVLSEDGLWNALSDYRAVIRRMLTTAIEGILIDNNSCKGDSHA